MVDGDVSAQLLLTSLSAVCILKIWDLGFFRDTSFLSQFAKSSALGGDFVVALDDEATFWTLQCMFHGEALSTATTIAPRGEVVRFESISDAKAILKLSGCQHCAIKRVWDGC